MALKDTLQAFALKHLPFAFCLLRNIKPVLTFGDLTIVSRFADVQEVLSRPDVFGVTYAQKMGVVTAGSNFFLGMDNTPTYMRDVSNMRILICREDIDSIIMPMIERLCREVLSGRTRELDVVKDLGGAVPARFVKEYMGVPGTSEAELIDWTTYLFQYLFAPKNPKEVDDKAVTDAAKLRAYLDDLIAKRKAAGVTGDDTIARSLALQTSGTPGMTDVDIRNNMIGIIIGAIPTTSKCVALVIDYLLDHPDLLAAAHEAALRDDNALMRKYVLESLRLNPFSPGIFRITNEDYTVAAGSFHATKIRKGEKVVVLTQSAMLDGRQVKSPCRFRLDRPDYQYMHFGYGMHTCFGQYINMAQIPLIVKAILKLPNLRRKGGEEGKIQSRDGFPTSLKVEFGA
ncbi:MAG TPA: cytochrome P450 [Rickettsiales bacterium]|nr:cytochrome P450 [Rickettsiales bacterium]